MVVGGDPGTDRGVVMHCLNPDRMVIRGGVPEGTRLEVATRSSNVSDSDSPLWSEWSAFTPAARFVATLRELTETAAAFEGAPARGPR